MDFENLHQILRNLYDEMIPLCESMSGVAKGLAGLAALFYISYRVWQSLARAEPIDVFPLLRPFAIGLCIMFFPVVVIGTINTVLSPIVTGTHQLLASQTMDMEEFAKQKDRVEIEMMKRNPETAYLVDDAEFDRQIENLGWGFEDIGTVLGMTFERGWYKLKKDVRNLFRDILELIYQAAALCIDTIRTFFLIVLTILGPISFAISVFDGFQSTLTQWLARYISIYLWLPVSDLFSCILSKIQVLILQQDIQSLQNEGVTSFDSSTSVYIIFMLIGIIGYFTIPTVASWIVHSGGTGGYGKTVNAWALKVGNFGAGSAGAISGNAAGRGTGH